MSERTLRTTLQSLGRRLFLIGAGSWVAWAVSAAFAVVVVAVWFDLMVELPPQLRIVALTAAGLAALGLAGWGWKRARQESAPLSLARRLDKVADGQGEIATGVDLLLDDQSTRSPLSAGLANMAVHRATRLAAQAPLPQAAPVRRLYPSLATVGAIAVGLLITAMVAPRLLATQWLRFSDPFGDHPPYSRLQLTVEPGDIRVVYGSPLDIKVAAEGAPVEQMELVLRSVDGSQEDVLPMFPEAPGRWRATIMQITQDGRYFARANRARSPVNSIEVFTIPQLTGAKFRVTPPAYTNRRPYEGSLPKEGLSGLPGTRVEVLATSNRPLSGGELTLGTEAGKSSVPLRPTAEGSQEVRGEFEIRASGKFRLQLVDTLDQRSADDFTAPITLLNDDRPFARILEPKEVSFATANVTLGVVLSAEDDYGLSRVQLFRSLNGSRAMPLAIPFTSPAKRVEEQATLPLSAYDLRPGDELQFFARVEDNDPAGAKGSESAIATLRIISQEDYERMVQTREGIETLLAKYQQAQRRLEAMSEEIAKLTEELAKQPADSELAEKTREELSKLSKRMEEEAEEIRKAAGQKLPYDIDKALSPEMEKLAKSLAEAAKQAGELSKKSGLKTGEAAKEMAKLQKKLAEQRKQFEENAADPLKALAQIYPLMEDQSRFVQLYQRQKDLAQRMASLKGQDRKDDPALRARMRDLETEQAHVREELRVLLDDIEAHVAQLPEDERVDKLRQTASKFVEDLRASGAAEAMADAEAGLAEFDGTRAAASSLQAEQILKKFLGECKGMGGQCKGCLAFQPKLSSCLGNSLEQLLASAGLGQGGEGGMGMGSGGYSAQRSALSNVGLYGNLPVASASNRGGSGNRSANGGTGRTLAGSDSTQATALQARGAAGVAGASETMVPTEYRRRVAEYFQRIADETNKR